MPEHPDVLNEELLDEGFDESSLLDESYDNDDEDDDDDELALVESFDDDDDDDDDEEFFDPISLGAMGLGTAVAGGLGAAAAGGLGAIAAPHVVGAGQQAIRMGHAALGSLLGGRPPRSRPKVRTRDYGRFVRGKRSAMISTPRGPVRARFMSSFVSSGQLRQALAAVRVDVNKVSGRVKSVERRMGKLVGESRRVTAAAIAGESAKCASGIKRLRRSLEKKLDESQQMQLIMSIMNEGDTGAGGSDMLLPLLLMSGKSDNQDMLMLMMAMNVIG